VFLSSILLPGLGQPRLPDGYALLLAGPAGSGKTSFALQFIDQGLGVGEKAVVVTFDIPEKGIFEAASGLGFDFINHKGDLSVLDYFSDRSYNYTDLSIALHKVMNDRSRKARIRIVIDSLSTLALLAGNDSLAPWVLQERRRLRDMPALALFCYDPGVHPPALKLALENVLDGTLELRLEEQDDGRLERHFRIFNLRGINHSSEWCKFDIVPGGGLRFHLE